MSQIKKALKSSVEEELQKGYLAVAELNLELAYEGSYSDFEALVSEEEKLMESE